MWDTIQGNAIASKAPCCKAIAGKAPFEPLFGQKVRKVLLCLPFWIILTRQFSQNLTAHFVVSPKCSKWNLAESSSSSTRVYERAHCQHCHCQHCQHCHHQHPRYHHHHHPHQCNDHGHHHRHHNHNDHQPPGFMRGPSLSGQMKFPDLSTLHFLSTPHFSSLIPSPRAGLSY